MNTPCEKAGHDRDVLLMEYASGALDEALSLAVASHVALCGEARRFVSSCETLGGALMETYCEPVALAEGSLSAVLNRIDTAPDEPAAQTSDFLRCLLQEAENAAAWRDVYRGLSCLDIPAPESFCRARLVRMAPGADIPLHGHGGIELTVVLEGALRDEASGYGHGELLVVDERITHRLIADESAGCLCLVASRSPVRFSRGLLRFLNSFVRF